MSILASWASVPRLAIGAEMPMPMKLRKASLKIAWGIISVTVTITGPRQLSSRCRKRIRFRSAPITKAATANSCSLRVMTWDLTIRAMLTQPLTQMPSITL